MIFELNGKQVDVSEELSITGLLEQENLLKAERIAVLLNGSIVSKADYTETAISSGDKLEIITIAAGG